MDPRTLTAALAVVCLAATIVVSALALYIRQTAHRIYSAGFGSITVGFLLLSLQGHVSNWIGIILANLLIMTFHFCLVWGVRLSTKEARPLPLRFAAYLLAWISLMVIATFALPDYALRATANSTLGIVLTCEFLSCFLRGNQEDRRALGPTVLVIGVGFAAFHAARLAIVLLEPSRSVGLMGGGLGITVLLVGYIFFLVAWAGIVLALEGAFLLHQVERKNAALRELASTDELTGLSNRHLFSVRIRDEVERSRRYHTPLSLIMFDLDHFKRVNDTWGHHSGDRVLVETAHLTRKLIREPDNIFRWGGEEFVIVTPHTGLEGGEVLAEKLRVAISTIEFPEIGRITASFGVTDWREGETQDEWFKRVDRALYRAKNAGRNRVVAVSALEKRPFAEVRIEWRADWDSGNATIDSQHQRLIELANRLLELSLSSESAPVITASLDILIEHVLLHFSDEERILKEVGYPEATTHARIHRSLVEEVMALKTRFDAGSLEATAFFDFLVGKVVMEHLQTSDRRFFGWTGKPQEAPRSLRQ
jgi:diguanylate cyclase (GGDEF)-like protein/hemerythrin-like metal-binding protein